MPGPGRNSTRPHIASSSRLLPFGRPGPHRFTLAITTLPTLLRTRKLLRDYAATHAGTVRLYDLADNSDGRPGPNGAAEPLYAVTLSDMGRLVVVNAGLAADDVVTLMDIDASGR